MVLLSFSLRFIAFTLTITLTQIADGFQSRMLMNNGLALSPQMGFDPLHCLFFLNFHFLDSQVIYLLWLLSDQMEQLESFSV